MGSTFDHNQAIGGNGNVDPDTGAAGSGVGGAIVSGSPVGMGSSLTVRESSFDHNQAVGGNGNVAPSVLLPLAPNIGGGGAITVFRGGLNGKNGEGIWISLTARWTTTRPSAGRGRTVAPAAAAAWAAAFSPRPFWAR